MPRKKEAAGTIAGLLTGAVAGAKIGSAYRISFWRVGNNRDSSSWHLGRCYWWADGKQNRIRS